MPKVLLIGDPMTDVNITCKVRGLCMEFPGVTLDEVKREEFPGGALNVKANLEAMGIEVEFVPTSTVSVKTRYYVDDRLVFRSDKNGSSDTVFLRFEDSRVYDAVVISDYDKGSKVILQDLYPPIFVDTKDKFPEKLYTAADFIFPNGLEWSVLVPHQGKFKHIIRKDSSNGCYVDGEHIPTTPVERADTVGAGDTFLAAFVACYLKKAYVDTSVEDQGSVLLTVCAKTANKAAGIACTKKGTATVTWNEVNGTVL